MKCTECKSAIWDYEEYYGTTQKERFVCGCKENKDPELCESEQYEGMCGTCHYWRKEGKEHCCMNYESIFAVEYMEATDGCNCYTLKRNIHLV